MFLPLLLASALPAAAAPRIEIDPQHRLVLVGLPPILADDGVKEHLTTGLTTTVTFRPGGKLGGGAWVEIRYDLWDEVFQLATAGADGRLEGARASSFEELLAWWQALRLPILDSARLGDRWPRRLEVTAEVVPFSQSEQADTQRWFSESIDRARRSGTGEVGQSGEERTETLSRTFDLLLATSIRRRALATYPWDLTLPPPPTRGAVDLEPAGGSP